MSEINFEADSGGAAGSDALARIAELAALMVEQQAGVAVAEETLRNAKEALLRTETEDLPELMREIGLAEVKLLDGSKVSIKMDVQCGLSEDRRAAGMRWLDEHGFGGMTKTELSIAFAKDEENVATELALKLADMCDKDVVLERSINAATLKAFIKEQLALGPACPLDADARKIFAVYPFDRAKLTAPKIKAPRRSRA